MKWAIGVFVGLAAMTLSVPFADGHFRLVDPTPWIEQNQLGDHFQKLGPCGGTSANGGTPTNAVTNAQGGQKLHVKVEEMVFHPGHYRIALAVNSRAELPEEPDRDDSSYKQGPIVRFGDDRRPSEGAHYCGRALATHVEIDRAV